MPMFKTNRQQGVKSDPVVRKKVQWAEVVAVPTAPRPWPKDPYYPICCFCGVNSGHLDSCRESRLRCDASWCVGMAEWLAEQMDQGHDYLKSSGGFLSGKSQTPSLLFRQHANHHHSTEVWSRLYGARIPRVCGVSLSASVSQRLITLPSFGLSSSSVSVSSVCSRPVGSGGFRGVRCIVGSGGFCNGCRLSEAFGGASLISQSSLLVADVLGTPGISRLGCFSNSCLLLSRWSLEHPALHYRWACSLDKLGFAQVQVCDTPIGNRAQFCFFHLPSPRKHQKWPIGDACEAAKKTYKITKSFSLRCFFSQIVLTFSMVAQWVVELGNWGIE